jgi:crotonobetainyl-CoA:carnitine CoA-transferase CaiB-like acyl-CoA transferase
LLKVALSGGVGAEVLRAPFNIEGVEEDAASVPVAGEQTDEVLRELGFAPEEILAMRDMGVV